MQVIKNLAEHQSPTQPSTKANILSAFQQNLQIRLEALAFDVQELLNQYVQSDQSLAPQALAQQLALITEAARCLGKDAEVWEYLRG